MILSEAEARVAMRLAIGRLFRLGSRPEQPGDEKQYLDCRAVVMEAGEVLGLNAVDRSPNWARDHAKGAAGD